MASLVIGKIDVGAFPDYGEGYLLSGNNAMDIKYYFKRRIKGKENGKGNSG